MRLAHSGTPAVLGNELDSRFFIVCLDRHILGVEVGRTYRHVHTEFADVVERLLALEAVLLPDVKRLSAYSSMVRSVWCWENSEPSVARVILVPGIFYVFVDTLH